MYVCKYISNLQGVSKNIPYGQPSAKLHVIMSWDHQVIMSLCHYVIRSLVLIRSSGHQVTKSDKHLSFVSQCVNPPAKFNGKSNFEID